MQKYLSPAKRYMSKVFPNTAEIKAFMQKRRIYVFGFVIMILLAVALSMAVVRGNMNKNNDAMKHQINVKGSSVTTTITNGGIPSIANGISNNSVDSKMNVMVNNQQINVPQNGSVSKTITNEDGSKTQVSVSHNSSSSGDSISSTTSTNVSTSTNTKSTDGHTP